MAKKRKSASTAITVRRVGMVEGTGAPMPAPRKARGPSRALVKATGAVASVRKVAARAQAVVRAEPTRIAAGAVVGNGLGYLTSSMIHDQAGKKPDGYAAQHEAAANLIGGLAMGALALGAGLMKGTSTTRQYVMHATAQGASHLLGAAGAIKRQQDKPVAPVAAPVPGTKGTEGDDPFRTDGDTGAGLRQKIKARFKAKIAERMRAEDPQGAGTEGPELEEYIGEVLDDVTADVQGAEEAIQEVGVLPLAAAAAAPQLVKALSKLLKLATKEGAQELQAQQADAPVTAAVCELEGADPLEIGAISKARELRREKRRLTREQRKAARKARREAREQRKVEKLQSEIDVLKPPRVIVVEREQQPASADIPLIYVPSSEEIDSMDTGRPRLVTIKQ